MLLTCQDLTKSFGENTIFSHISFHIDDGEKVALIGNNGVGKTTLFRLIMKEYEPDCGMISYQKDLSIGYLAQHRDYTSHFNVYEDLLSSKQELIDMESKLRLMEHKMNELVSEAQTDSFLQNYHVLMNQFELMGGYTFRSEIIGILNGLGFTKEDYDKSVLSLSGGERTRLSLGRILLQKPDLILLDEPTNYLDIDSVQWLETYLCNVKSALLLVSHDRYFINKVVTKVIEIENHEALQFDGNYDIFMQKKDANIQSLQKTYENQQREIHHREEVIKRLKSFNREKSIKRAESHEKMLNRIERIDKPQNPKSQMQLILEPLTRSGNDVLQVTDISKTYGDRNLFHNLSFQVKRGEHIALIGKNGTGKTNILKIINGNISSDCGSVSLGANVIVGYFDQQSQLLDDNKSIFDEISDTYPKLDQTQIRSVLAAFLFTGETVFRQITSLSGGERGRVVLAKLMLSGANFLILDEPTNHLDMTSKAILENALNAYIGTVLYVSHDRYFIQRTAHRVLELEDNKLTCYSGDYEYYLAKKAEQSASVVSENIKSLQPGTNTPNKSDWASQKEQQAAKRKKMNEITRIENRIEELELFISESESEMSLPANATNSVLLQELCSRCGNYQSELELLYQKWEALNEETDS